MSKKEQKLKKNLYKALTEYFIHNPKNSLTSSESFLDQLAAFRIPNDVRNTMLTLSLIVFVLTKFNKKPYSINKQIFSIQSNFL